MAAEEYPNFQKKTMAKLVEWVYNDVPGAPPYDDTESFNTGIPCDGYPFVFDAVVERPTILHLDPNAQPRHIGYERIKLRWVKPNANGEMVPR